MLLSQRVGIEEEEAGVNKYFWGEFQSHEMLARLRDMYIRRRNVTA